MNDVVTVYDLCLYVLPEGGHVGVTFVIKLVQ